MIMTQKNLTNIWKLLCLCCLIIIQESFLRKLEKPKNIHLDFIKLNVICYSMSLEEENMLEYET